jgi:hypothetical protein
VILLLLLALLAIVVFGFAFTAHWFFLTGAILAFGWLLAFLLAGRPARRRSAWQ